jgi:hypothetical protein
MSARARNKRESRMFENAENVVACSRKPASGAMAAPTKYWLLFENSDQLAYITITGVCGKITCANAFAC